MRKFIKNVINLGLAVGLAWGSPPAARIGPDAPGIQVRVFDDAGVPDEILRRSMEIASAVFHRSRLQTVWLSCSPSKGHLTPPPACGLPSGPYDLILRVRPRYSPLYAGHGDQFGVALLSPGGRFGRYAYVFLDRIEAWCPKELWQMRPGRLAGRIPLNEKTPLLLGVVMAHEVGHLLLGSQTHSKSGIMKPNWSRSDLEEAYWGRLAFAPGQIRQLGVKIQARVGNGREPPRRAWDGSAKSRSGAEA